MVVETMDSTTTTIRIDIDTITKQRRQGNAITDLDFVFRLEETTEYLVRVVAIFDSHIIIIIYLFIYLFVQADLIINSNRSHCR
jgi:hypothetical protein